MAHFGKRKPQKWLGTWNSSTEYQTYDVVHLNGVSYICTAVNTNQSPPNATYWDVLADKGADGATGPAGADGQGVPAGGTSGQVLEKIDGTDYNTQWATPAGGGGVFGTEYQHEKKAAAVSTTSDLYTEAHTMVTPSIPAGNYLLMFKCRIKNDTAGKRPMVRVQWDDDPSILGNALNMIATDEYLNVVDFTEISFGTTGVHDFDVDIKNEAGTDNTTTIRHIEMTLWRVS